jgi:ABC-2 type transport system permease protein
MNSSIKRIGAIFIKELQDIRSNINVLFMYFLPILIFIIFNGLIADIPLSWTLAFSLVMLVGEVCVFIPAMIIAEEKEKKTLGVLMLSPATPFEIFAGKGLLTFLSVMFTALILTLMAGTGLQHLGVILTGTALATIVCVLLGMIVGLISQNQMSTGMIGLPIILPFIMLPYLSIMGNDIIIKIARIIPTYYYFKMVSLGVGQGEGLGSMFPYMGALAGSILIAFALLLLVYRKKGLE